jgi:hypothetical protein
MRSGYLYSIHSRDHQALEITSATNGAIYPMTYTKVCYGCWYARHRFCYPANVDSECVICLICEDGPACLA